MSNQDHSGFEVENLVAGVELAARGCRVRVPAESRSISDVTESLKSGHAVLAQSAPPPARPVFSGTPVADSTMGNPLAGIGHIGVMPPMDPYDVTDERLAAAGVNKWAVNPHAWQHHMQEWIAEWGERKQFFSAKTIDGECPVKMTAGDLVLVGLGKVLVKIAKAAEYARKGKQDEMADALFAAEEEIARVNLESHPLGTSEEFFISNADAFCGKAFLIATEAAEAIEAAYAGDREHVAEELADADIRIKHLYGTLDIDGAVEVEKKMAVNETRPIKHGKKTNL
jgi:NTP pyrophosphatase (non-canonical NTP hydrolase)